MEIKKSTRIVYSLEGLTKEELRTIDRGLARLRSSTYPQARDMSLAINKMLRMADADGITEGMEDLEEDENDD